MECGTRYGDAMEHLTTEAGVICTRHVPLSQCLMILQRSEPDRIASFSVEARRIRRQRDLDKVEIPQHDVTVTNELLGKDGFGTVYIADYNGRNSAAKVSSC